MLIKGESMSENIEKFLTELKTVLEATEQYLESQENTVNSVTLLAMIAKNADIAIEDVSKMDNTIRFYIKNYSDFEITRGVNGGFRKKGTGGGVAKAKAKSKSSATSAEVKSLVDAKIASMASQSKPLEIKTKEVTEDLEESVEIIEQI